MAFKRNREKMTTKTLTRMPMTPMDSIDSFLDSDSSLHGYWSSAAHQSSQELMKKKTITGSISNGGAIQSEMKRGIQKFVSSSPMPSSVMTTMVPPANAADGTMGAVVPSATATATSSTSTFVAAAAATVPSSSSSQPSPPTKEEIKLLREALGAIYGERNPEKASELLTQAIAAWERQPPDERAALYRVRGDCFMELLDAPSALQDYTITIALLTGPGGDLADPAELPAAYLGQARALRSLPSSSSSSSSSSSLSSSSPLSKEQYQLASKDYQLAMRLTSREEWDTNDELEADGAQRNPYAAWEWGMALRGEGNYRKAAQVHLLASTTFKDIGDRARSVISKLDAGIDLAANVASASASGSTTEELEETIQLLKDGIGSTTSVEGRDVALLQRVIAKEGEARIALASILWSANQKSQAEAQLGEACGRLEQLQLDADAREKGKLLQVNNNGNNNNNNNNNSNKKSVKTAVMKKLPFSIDDTVGTECSCSRFKNSKFLDSLVWPESLQEKVSKLNNLVS